ncbi:MAG: OmpA family protein [Bacteroidales bacterium]|jgi:outer membrane protein OmpA-like peptidoglycan-associated protein|nr:OmpA family protein [Bacteroidales bacterium]
MKLRVFLFIVLGMTVCLTAKSQSEVCETKPNKTAEKLYKRAREAQNKGENDKATTLFKLCIEEQEDWATPYFYLGMQTIRRLEQAMEKTDRLFQTAINYFEKVMEYCPEYNMIVYLHLGKLYYSTGQYGKAVRYLELFLEDPEKIKNQKQQEEAEWFLEYSLVYEKLYASPVPFNPVPVKGMSTEEDEYLGTISPDDDYMFYTRRKIVTSQQYGTKTTEIKEVFTMSKRIDDASFSVGTPMPSPPFNMTKNEGSPTITLDNKYMVFTRCADITTTDQTAYYNCDLYFSEFKNGQWSEIRNLGKAINRDDTWESQACISADGKTLYFVSDRAGGYGGYDIYYSVRDANGAWKKAENAGNIINTDRDEKTPFLHSDNKTLYYSSKGFTGLGGFDIYVSHLSSKGGWSKPVNIGYPINSAGDDVGLFVSTIGNKAYFASNRLSGNWDICGFDLHEQAQPQKLILIKGQVVNGDEEITSVVELKNITTKQTEKIEVNEQTGNYSAIIDDTDNDYLLTIKQKGYAYETKYIETQKLLSENKQLLVTNDIELKPVQVGASYRINDIYFATNSSELTSSDKFVLDILIEFLQDNPSIKIEIQGHTDNIGNRKDNLILSENRAKEVYNYLIQNRIHADRLKYKGYADTNPIADNATEEGRSKNRRTVFVILSN